MGACACTLAFTGSNISRFFIFLGCLINSKNVADNESRNGIKFISRFKAPVPLCYEMLEMLFLFKSENREE